MVTEKGGRWPYGVGTDVCAGRAGAGPRAFQGRWLLTVLLAVLLPALLALLLAAGGAGAAEPKLLAPVYPGARPMVTENGKPGPCSKDEVEQWCFLTNDPIDKVKAFYDKNVGGLEARKNGRGYFAWLQWIDSGELDEDHFGGVELRSGPPAPTLPKGDDAGMQAIAQKTTHFQALAGAVQWPGAPAMVNPMMGKLHAPAEFAKLYERYGYLESSFFPTSIIGKESIRADERLRKEAEAKAQQAGSQASEKLASSSQEQGSRNMAMAGRPNPAAQQEDAELKRLLDKNPKVANAYAAKAQHASELIQQGDYRGAAQEGKEGEKILRSDPAIAAHLDQVEARRKQASAQGQQQQESAQQNRMSAYSAAMDYSRWGVWTEYLAAASKVAYRVRIVLDAPASAKTKGVSRDRAQVAAKWKAQQERWQGQGRGPEGEELAESGSGTQPSAGKSTPAKTAPPAKPAPAAAPPSTADKATDAAKQGVKLLKKLF